MLWMSQLWLTKSKWHYLSNTKLGKGNIIDALGTLDDTACSVDIKSGILDIVQQAMSGKHNMLEYDYKVR